jgi:thioredoxin-like negative regulator of GroEL
LRKGTAVEMQVRRAKIAALLLVVGLVAVLAPVCGCGSPATTTGKGTGSSSPRNTAPKSQSTSPSAINETSESEAALAQAKAGGKPVLLKFGSGTCISCKQIEENINKIKPEYEGKVAFVIVDVYDQKDDSLTKEYGIQTIPTTYFLGKDGSVVKKVVGVMEPDQLKQQLDALL